MKTKFIRLGFTAVLLTLISLLPKSAFPQSGEIPVDPQVLPIVVKIKTFSQLKKKLVSGTGFIVSREVSTSSGTARANFLVTNKHMLSDWTLADAKIAKFNEYIDAFFYRDDPSVTRPVNPTRIILCDDQGHVFAHKVQTHEDPIVDVAIVYLNEDLKDKVGINLPSFDLSYLRPFDSITSLYFNIGSQVFVLGYPLGITSLRNSLPIAKFGFIASTPGQEFALDLNVKNRAGENKTVKLTGKIIVIDGLIVPGNSGGPVILPSVIKTRINPETQEWEHSTKPTENLVIGILAGGFGASGLSYILSSDYVVETIDQFLMKRKWESMSRWP